jgi:cardiolipin synthase
VARPDWLTAPNVVTLFRLALVPVFLAFHLIGHADWALACCSVAALSDVLDGLLARVLNQRSKLGAMLDPIADKALVFAALSSLVLEQRIPPWLWGLVVLRDAGLIVGALMVRHRRLDVPVQPTRIGKYATFTLTLLVVLALTDQILSSALLHAYTQVVGIIAGLCVVISALQYLDRFVTLFSSRPSSSV